MCSSKMLSIGCIVHLYKDRTHFFGVDSSKGAYLDRWLDAETGNIDTLFFEQLHHGQVPG